MKKNNPLPVILLCLFCCTGFHSVAQKKGYRSLKKGEIQANVSIGLVPTYLLDGGRGVIPPLAVKMNYHLSKHFSLTATAGYSKTLSKISPTPKNLQYQWQNSLLFTGIGSSIHRKIHKYWEVYGGLQIGFFFSHITLIEGKKEDLKRHYGVNTLSGTLSWSSILGIRYHANNRISSFLELGYGVSLVNAGVGYRLE